MVVHHCECDKWPVKMVNFILRMVRVLSHSVVSDSATPGPAAHPAPLSMGFSQECWREEPFLLPGGLPGLGIEPTSPASPALAGEFFTTEPLGSHMTHFFTIKKIHMFTEHQPHTRHWNLASRSFRKAELWK